MSKVILKTTTESWYDDEIEALIPEMGIEIIYNDGDTNASGELEVFKRFMNARGYATSITDRMVVLSREEYDSYLNGDLEE